MEMVITENTGIQARKRMLRRKHSFRIIWRIFILLGLMLAGFFCFWLWPSISGPMTVILVIGMLGMAMIVTVQGNGRAYKLGKISQRELSHKNLVDVFGIILTMALAILAGGTVSGYVSPLAGKAAKATFHGTGFTAGLLAGIFAGMLVGLGIGYLVRWIWGMLTKPRNSVPAKSSV
jgi:hypothetical protein